jgi:twitching motility protein PilT
MTTPEEDSHEEKTVADFNTQAKESGTVRQRKATIVLRQTEQEVKNNLVTLEKLLNVAIRGGASDLLLKVGQTPMFRYNGDLYPLRDGPRIDRSMIEAMVHACVSQEKLQALDRLHDIDASYCSELGGRTRINIFRQRGELGMVIRLIPPEAPTIDQLGMSAVLKQITEAKRGLILVTGATGSGKSTTLAALIDHINRNRTTHIITVEDPIEYVHSDKRSMINQREISVDCVDFSNALRSAMRQNPDVILVGELRDPETLETALQAAETGHLVMSTLHANDAPDALTRLFGIMGAARESMLRLQLAESLRAIISQRLVRRRDRRGRVAAQEILINTATIRERILKGAAPGLLRDFVAQGQSYGMQTFDQHLLYLCQQGIIEIEEGHLNATNRDDFDLRIRGINADQRG